MKLYCESCRKELLEIPTFIPNSELKVYLIIIKCPFCEEYFIYPINISKKENKK